MMLDVHYDNNIIRYDTIQWNEEYNYANTMSAGFSYLRHHNNIVVSKTEDSLPYTTIIVRKLICKQIL